MYSLFRSFCVQILFHDLLPIKRNLIKLYHFRKLYILILHIDESSFTFFINCEGHKLFYAKTQSEWFITHIDNWRSAPFGWSWRYFWQFSWFLWKIVSNILKLLHFFILILFFHINFFADEPLIFNSEADITNFYVHIMKDFHNQSIKVPTLIIFYFHLHRFFYHVFSILFNQKEFRVLIKIIFGLIKIT